MDEYGKKFLLGAGVDDGVNTALCTKKLTKEEFLFLTPLQDYLGDFIPPHSAGCTPDQETKSLTMESWDHYL